MINRAHPNSFCAYMHDHQNPAQQITSYLQVFYDYGTTFVTFLVNKSVKDHD